MVQVEFISDKTIEIIVKDTQNLNEYASVIAFEKDYL